MTWVVRAVADVRASTLASQLETLQADLKKAEGNFDHFKQFDYSATVAECKALVRRSGNAQELSLLARSN